MAYLYAGHKLGEFRALERDGFAALYLGSEYDAPRIHLTSPDARQLLAAAFEAVRILDPDGAPDALIGLIEGDALAKIRARIREEDAAPEAAKAARIRKLIAEGQALGIIEPTECLSAFGLPHGGIVQCTEPPGHDGDHVAGGTDVTWPQDAAPDTAQPEDIPVAAACRWCATTEGILLQFGALDDGNPRWFCGDVKACYERRPIDGTCEVCSIPVTGGEIGPDGVTWLCEDHRADPAAGICPSCGSEDPAQCGLVPGRTGMPVSCTDDWHDGAAPDTAQPEDIPEPGGHYEELTSAGPRACGRCGATEETGPLIDVGVAHGVPTFRCNERQRCAERRDRHMARIAGAK